MFCTRATVNLFLVIFVCPPLCQAQERSPLSKRKELQELANAVKRLQAPRLLVQPGTEDEATKYYKRIGTVLQFDFLNSNLNSFLAYLGYSKPATVGMKTTFKGLRAKDLKDIDSFSLMPRNQTEFDALSMLVDDPVGFQDLLALADFKDEKVRASRFFAPKIATYFDPNNPFRPIDPDDIVPGWRKLVRLAAREGSAAEAAGVKHIYLLFNFKRADPDVDPYVDNVSGNNQVIIIPEDQTRGDTCFFVVYQSRTVSYKNGLFLAADFDLPGHVGTVTPGAPDGQYFVPRACAECHGHSGGGLRGEPVKADGTPTQDFSLGIYKFAKPNYLDTDQWYDWMEFDYRGVATSLNDVIFDGGKDHGSPAYERAFEVVRRLNTTIRDETFVAERTPGVKSYQTLAAEKWLSLHTGDDQRKPYSVRSIGTQTWDAANGDEMRLLRLLNNHCFRCHSSLRYSVFDRAAVKARAPLIKAYLRLSIQNPNGGPLPGFFMPQGRVLPADERDEMIDLTHQLFGP